MKVLHISGSSRGQDSESFRLSEAVIRHLTPRHPGVEVISRKLTPETISHVDSDYATALGGLRLNPPIGMPPGSLSESERLIRELEEADCLVIGTPMHNYSIPSTLKAWVDHVVRVNRTFQSTPQGKIGTLRDRPVFIVISSGGIYSGDSPRQPDFLTPYLTAILNTIGLRNITFFSVQGTAYGSEVLENARKAALASLADYFRTVTV